MSIYAPESNGDEPRVGPPGPRLIVVGGLPGVGKTTGERIRAAARAGALRGIPAGGAQVEPIGWGESYTAWLVRIGDQSRVLRVQRRPPGEMPRPMAQELAALTRVPPQLGTRAIAMEADPGNPLGAPYMVTTYVPGRVLQARDWGSDLAEALAHQIARLHLALAEPEADDLPADTGKGAQGEPLVPVPPASAQGEEVLTWWREHHPETLRSAQAAPLLEAWRRELARLDAAFEDTPTHPLIHGDVVITNVVVGEDGLPRLIDFEWAGPGDVAKDLALIGGTVSGGPWYVSMGRADVVAFVGHYARSLEALANRAPERWAGGWRPNASATDPRRLLARRDAYELLDRLANLLYCLSRRDQAPHYTTWADELATSLAARLRGGPVT